MQETILDDKKEYRAFLKWLVTPTTQKVDKKMPVSVKEYSEKNKIDITTLASFYQEDNFPDDILEATISWMKTQTPGMASALYDRFMATKNSKDLLAFLDFIKVNNKKDDKGSTFNQFNFINPTSEQYEQIVRREARVINGESRIIDATLTGATALPEGSSETSTT